MPLSRQFNSLTSPIALGSSYPVTGPDTSEVFDDHPGPGQRPELFVVEAFVAKVAKNAAPARLQYRYFASTK